MLHADNTNAFQMISYTNVDKDLDRNEHLNLNLEKNTSLTAACFSQNRRSKQQLMRLIYLTGYDNLYR